VAQSLLLQVGDSFCASEDDSPDFSLNEYVSDPRPPLYLALESISKLFLEDFEDLKAVQLARSHGVDLRDVLVVQVKMVEQELRRSL